jgi:hypothetical protein
MRLMRNIRSGRNAVYDQSCVDSGGWVPVVDDAPADDAPVAKTSKPGRRKAEPNRQVQEVGATDPVRPVDEIKVSEIFAPPVELTR